MWIGLDWTGSGQGPVAGCCECGDEPSGSCSTELVSYVLRRTILRNDKTAMGRDRFMHYTVHYLLLTNGQLGLIETRRENVLMFEKVTGYF
jgi:hypothetical protein